MAKNKKFYKGKRKRKNYAFIPIVAFMLLAVVVIVLFYGMQKYAVITKEDVAVELPYMKTDNTVIDEYGHEVKVFDKVETTVTFKQRDYSSVTPVAGKDAGELRAIFVSAGEATREKILEYDARLSSGNALVIEMKPREGNLKWYSNSVLAQSYGVSSEFQQTADIKEAVATVKENGHYIVAQISCCIDNMLPSRSTSVALTSMYVTYYTN